MDKTMDGNFQRMEAAKEIIHCIRSVGGKICVLANGKIYADLIPIQIVPETMLLIPELIQLLEREGRVADPSVEFNDNTITRNDICKLDRLLNNTGVLDDIDETTKTQIDRLPVNVKGQIHYPTNEHNIQLLNFAIILLLFFGLWRLKKYFPGNH